MQNNKKKKEKNSSCRTLKSKIRYIIFIALVPLIVFSIGVIPVILCLILLFLIIPYSITVYLILAPIIFVFSIYILIVSEIFVTGLFIRFFRVKYKEGTYEYSFNDNNSLKWILVCQLYTPIRKIFETIPMGEIKNIYLKLLGMKIGKNSLIGGVIKDPCMTEIGDNVTIGEYAILYSHIHNKQEGTITITPIKIGNNCVIGAGAIIMPGVIMNDDSTIAAAAVVVKNRVLEKNKIYGGNPAKEITKKGKK